MQRETLGISKEIEGAEIGRPNLTIYNQDGVTGDFQVYVGILEGMGVKFKRASKKSIEIHVSAPGGKYDRTIATTCDAKCALKEIYKEISLLNDTTPGSGDSLEMKLISYVTDLGNEKKY